MLTSALAFTPSSISVYVNGLWFSSLVCSLITASFGILVKQWLREYMAIDSVAAQEFCRVRYTRRQGLIKYRVLEIASFLPLLLQSSLLLFFVGLIEFIRPIHTVIGWVVASLVIIWAFLYVGSTLTPAFSSSCPYTTPFLTPLFVRTRRFLQRPLGQLRTFLQGWIFGLKKLFLQLGSHVVSRRRLPIVEKRDRSAVDTLVLADADNTFRDNEVLDTILRCALISLSPADSSELVGKLIEGRWKESGYSYLKVDVLLTFRLPIKSAPGLVQASTQMVEAAFKKMLRKCSQGNYQPEWHEVKAPLGFLFLQRQQSLYSSFVEALLTIYRVNAQSTPTYFETSLIRWAAWMYEDSDFRWHPLIGSGMTSAQCEFHSTHVHRHTSNLSFLKI